MANIPPTQDLQNAIPLNPGVFDGGNNSAPPETTNTPVQDQELHASAKTEAANNAPAAIEGSFSIYSVKQKRWIIIAASFAGLFSPLSSSIYFPALSTVAHDLKVTSAKVNLTVTTFLVSRLHSSIFWLLANSDAL